MKKKYYGIDWLRAFSCVGVMLMHMSCNNDYLISSFFYRRVILSFTDLVFLFMVISAFGMCCGYHDKVLSGKIDWTNFYKKRYLKILPFYALLIFIDLIMGFSVTSLVEGLTEMTLLFGLLPVGFTVIGVSWFLGIVFIFYLIFPFFCVLIETKKRAWICWIISVILNLVCHRFFSVDRTNFLYCLCYFITGGLIFIYRKQLRNVKLFVSIPLIMLSLFFYYKIGACTFTLIPVCAAFLIFAISANLPDCLPIRFMSNISLEFFLSHMVIFRGIQKTHLNTVFGNGWLQYCITVVLVFVCTVIFSALVQHCFNKLLKNRLH